MAVWKNLPWITEPSPSLPFLSLSLFPPPKTAPFLSLLLLLPSPSSFSLWFPSPSLPPSPVSGGAGWVWGWGGEGGFFPSWDLAPLVTPTSVRNAQRSQRSGHWRCETKAASPGAETQSHLVGGIQLNSSKNWARAPL